jgi:hypothetical protein
MGKAFVEIYGHIKQDNSTHPIEILDTIALPQHSIQKQACSIKLEELLQPS